MIFFILIFLILFVYYLRYVFLFKEGLKKKYINPNINKSFVSVVVAARNEEENISSLLTCLVNQNYPDDRYEVIIADDNSTDRTTEIVERFQKRFENVKLVRVKSSRKVISRKKNALTQAIERSKGKFILSTDADCLVKNSWIEGMVRYFGREVGMVAGLSLPRLGKNANFVQKLEYFDMVVMFLAAAGAIGKGKPFSCSGQNLAFSREAFDKVGGYEKIKNYQSGDDVLLMQLIRQAGYKISFAFGARTYAKTASESNLLNFLNQRIRWASNEKPQSFLNKEFFFYLSDVFLLNILLIVTVFFYPLLFFAFFVIKMISEFLFIKNGLKRFGIDKRVLKYFTGWFIFHPIYILITGVGGKLNLFKWK